MQAYRVQGSKHKLKQVPPHESESSCPRRLRPSLRTPDNLMAPVQSGQASTETRDSLLPYPQLPGCEPKGEPRPTDVGEDPEKEGSVIGWRRRLLTRWGTAEGPKLRPAHGHGLGFTATPSSAAQESQAVRPKGSRSLGGRATHTRPGQWAGTVEVDPRVIGRADDDAGRLVCRSGPRPIPSGGRAPGSPIPSLEGRISGRRESWMRWTTPSPTRLWSPHFSVCREGLSYACSPQDAACPELRRFLFSLKYLALGGLILQNLDAIRHRDGRHRFFF